MTQQLIMELVSEGGKVPLTHVLHLPVYGIRYIYAIRRDEGIGYI